MQDFLSVRRFLRLTSQGPFLDAKKPLAPEITSVAIHQPAKFIGLLRFLWRSNVEQGLVNDYVCKQLREILALCEDGMLSPLQNTILRLPVLERLCSQYGIATEAIPFLKVPHYKSDQDASGWQFLGQLGVTLDDGIRFYLHLLRAASLRDPTVLTVRCLYAALRAKCAKAADSKMAQSITGDLAVLRYEMFLKLHCRSKSSWKSLHKFQKGIRVGEADLRSAYLHSSEGSMADS